MLNTVHALKKRLPHAAWLYLKVQILPIIPLYVQGTVHALKTIAASEGASGLLRGFWPTVLSNAPFSAVYYMLYSDLRKRFQKASLQHSDKIHG